MTLVGRLSCLRSPGGNDWSNHGGTGPDVQSARPLGSFLLLNVFSLTILGGGRNHYSCSVSWCSASHEVFCACKESTGLFQQNAIKAHLSFQMLYLWQKRRENIEMFSERSSMVKGFYRRISQKLTGTHTDRSFHKIFYIFNLFYNKCIVEVSPRLHLFDRKTNKSSNTVKYYFNLKCLFYVIAFKM